MNKNEKMPRWLELQAEIDFLLFELKRMLKKEKSLPGMYKAIDQATGYDKIKLKKARKIMKKITKLKQEYYKETQ
jgi:hypothetical protein